MKSLDLLGPHVPELLLATNSLGSQSPSTRSQVIQAFRFLGLVAPDGTVNADLRLLVEHVESRPQVVSRVLRAAYPDIFSDGGKRISVGLLESFISRSPLGPPTRRKAVAFVLNAARFSGIPADSTDVARPGVDQGAHTAIQPAATKRSMSLMLKTGGTIELSVEFDPFRLDKFDRAFVFELIDKLRGYKPPIDEQDTRADLDHEDRQSELHDEAPF
jgi:hypothetical protein